MVTHIVFWALKDEAEGHSKRENAEHTKRCLKRSSALSRDLSKRKSG